MMMKKIAGVIGIILSVVLLFLVAAQFISLRLFWMAMILIAAGAYLVLPYLEDS